MSKSFLNSLVLFALICICLSCQKFENSEQKRLPDEDTVSTKNSNISNLGKGCGEHGRLLKDVMTERWIDDPIQREKDSLVLIKLKEVNPNSKLKEWDTTVPLEKWFGVGFDPGGNHSTVTSLTLSHFKIDSLPQEITKLINLESLELKENDIRSLPEGMGAFSKIWDLDVSQNNISSIPNSFYNMEKLAYLNLSGNRITSLSPEIKKLSKLSRLYLSGNKVRSIPEELGELKSLIHLYIENNDLYSLPDAITKLDSMYILLLAGNPIKKESLTKKQIQWLAGHEIDWKDIVDIFVFNVNNDDTLPYFDFSKIRRETEISIDSEGVITRDSAYAYEGNLSWNFTRNERGVLSRSANKEFKYEYADNKVPGKYTVCLKNNKVIVSNIISYETTGEQEDFTFRPIEEINLNAALPPINGNNKKRIPIALVDRPFSLSVDKYGTVERNKNEKRRYYQLEWNIVSERHTTPMKYFATSSLRYQFYNKIPGKYTIYLTNADELVSNVVSFVKPVYACNHRSCKTDSEKYNGSHSCKY